MEQYGFQTAADVLPGIEQRYYDRQSVFHCRQTLGECLDLVVFENGTIHQRQCQYGIAWHKLSSGFRKERK